MSLFKKKVVTRFAPSPTGYSHIGGLRTALYAYLYARQNKGDFLLRIEDTDRSRYVAGAIEDIIEVLENLGIKPDNELYRQSDHLDIYKNKAEELVKQDQAYYCFCSAERLIKLREEQVAKKQPPGYDGRCRSLSAEQVENYLRINKSHVIRFKTPHHQIVEFNDVVHGPVKINTENIDDQVLIKSDGYPTYHLAVVIDDHKMGITHVIRGEEWLPSTPKHVLLYQAFSWPLPSYVHLPLLLNKDRSKLSKRTGDVAAKDYLEKGYLPTAIINFIALLGWNPGTDKEVFSLAELLKEFSLKKINKSGAIFDITKLNWFNQTYLQQLDQQSFYQLSQAWLANHEPNLVADYNQVVARASQTRISNFSEIPEIFSHIFVDEFTYPTQELIFKKSDKISTTKGLTTATAVLEKIANDDWTVSKLELVLNNLVIEQQLGNGDVFWPIRYALSGKTKSESPVELLTELGKDKSLLRINKAISLLKKI